MSTEPPTLRPANPGDGEVLREMLVLAANWRTNASTPTVAEVMADPTLSRYIEGRPRPGDRGVVAETDRPVGAAWWRFFSAEEHGYGFVDAAVPEISIAVRANWRGRGIGGRMLRSLVETAHVTDVPALSLSVEPDNPAVALYRRVGFTVVDRDKGALTMLLRIADR